MGEYREDTEFPDKSTTVSYSGEGGLHQLYLGAGFKIIKNLSVGANFSYLWGDITRTAAETFPSSSSVFPITIQSNVAVKSYKLDFGAQYTHQFGKKHVATLGVVFSPGHDLNNDAYEGSYFGNEGYYCYLRHSDNIWRRCDVRVRQSSDGRSGCDVPELEQSELYEQ